MVLDEPKDTDESYQINELTYIIDKALLAQVGEVKVDYVDNGWQQGFTLSSAKPLGGGGGGGGCGTSCSC